MRFRQVKQLFFIAFVALIVLQLGACAQNRRQKISSLPYHRGYVKDSRPGIWLSNQKRVQQFRQQYRQNGTVEAGLKKGAPYLPHIIREFRTRSLPQELAYLPILESFFENDANSGVAKGMWQFTRQTATHVGLQVGTFRDERLNWRKASAAAADYLDELGKMFDYDWALALAAYNGGPGALRRRIKDQGTRDYFQLKLPTETHNYVPRYLAIVQVAKEKYPHLLNAGL